VEVFAAMMRASVLIVGRIIAVPFVQDKDRIFLKTAFPSKKMTKLYNEEQK
jgi:hypothetical protein